MLNQDLTFQIFKQTDHYLKEKLKKTFRKKNKIDIDSSKEFVKNNTIILKKQNKDLKVKSIRLLQKILTRFL